MATDFPIRPDGANGKDVHLQRANPTTNYGTGTALEVDGSTGTAHKRGLIEFDLSYLPGLVSSKVLAAWAILKQAETPTGSDYFDLHRITAAWVESEVTWNNRDAGNAWTAAGGDFDATASASQQMSTSAPTLRNTNGFWLRFAIKQLVKDWLDATFANDGVLIKRRAETSVTGASSVGSSDNGTAANRPYLWIENTDSPINLMSVSDGSFQEWTGATRTPNWEALCNPPNIVAEFDAVDDITSGASPLDKRFSTNLMTNAVPAGAAITSVKVVSRFRRSGTSGAVSARVGFRIGGSEYYHATSCDESAGMYTTFVREFTTNPATSNAWQVSEVNAGLEALIKATHTTTPAILLSKLHAVVTFTIASQVQRITSEDAHISDSAQNNNYGNAADIRTAWNVGSLGKRNRGLLKWDLSGLSSSVVIRARLRISYDGTGGYHSSLFTHDLHLITADWAEMQATWLSRKTGVAWTTAGGDYDGAALISRAGYAVNAKNQFIYSDLTQVVKDWLDGVSPNYGILSKCNVESGGGLSWLYIDSREGTQGVLMQPTLIIDVLETTAKTGADSGQGTETTIVAGEITAKSSFDSAATDKERAGYYTLEHMYFIPELPPEQRPPPWMWVFHPGVEAFHEQQQDGAATEGAGQVVHNQLAVSDSGALTDQKVEPPVVEHLRQEPGAGVDLAALWYEIALTDSNASADDQAVIEINPIVGSDVGAGADSAQTPVGYYEGVDAGVGADAQTGLSAELSGIADAAAAVESAQRIAILSRHIMECSVESSLEALADAFDLTLVESDPSDPLTPKAQAWRTLDEGDLVQVRLGLAGLGFDDYGVFRIDGAAVRVSERQIVTELHGRDKAALLIEEKGRDLGGFRLGAYPEQDQTQATRPHCSSIAARLAARVGLGLVWDAPSYSLKEFTVRPDESVSSALNRLLGPLQVSRRYRTDAWVDGENLVVRRRGNGPIIGALDCRQGLIRSISRERQPTVGEVTVRGGTEVVRTTYVPEDHREEKGSDKRESQVEIEDDGSGHRVVRTYLQQPDGAWVQTQEEVEDQDFQEVWDGDRWIGRVLLESETTITTDMHLSTRKTERRITRLSYDGEWRLIRREESKRVYNSESHAFELKEKSLVRFEQITPTDVRTTTTEWKVVSGDLKVKSGYPTRVEQPGTLQSALHTTSSLDNAWDQKEDGTQPERWRKVEQTRQYQGGALGTLGGIPREHSDANLMSDGACYQIAEDMASESGQWLYQFELFWPRPLPYRKGDRVTLTQLPAEMPNMVAIITRVRTQFNVAEAAWTHDISLEAWADS